MSEPKRIEPVPKMTVTEFLEWADAREGRYELERGVVVAMAPANFSHSRVKGAAWLALAAAIKRAGKSCEAVIDGVGVSLQDETCYIPDVVVYCGDRAPGAERIAPNPLIVVEVTSPSTARFDRTSKLSDYFAIGSIAHYLIADPTARTVVHHRRGEGRMILTEIIRDGDISLDPPGLSVAMTDLFGEYAPISANSA